MQDRRHTVSASSGTLVPPPEFEPIGHDLGNGHALPNEVLQKIFENVSQPIADLVDIIAISQTCQRWRAVSLAVPSLWSNWLARCALYEIPLYIIERIEAPATVVLRHTRKSKPQNHEWPFGKLFLSKLVLQHPGGENIMDTVCPSTRSKKKNERLLHVGELIVESLGGQAVEDSYDSESEWHPIFPIKTETLRLRRFEIVNLPLKVIRETVRVMEFSDIVTRSGSGDNWLGSLIAPRHMQSLTLRNVTLAEQLTPRTHYSRAFLVRNCDSLQTENCHDRIYDKFLEFVCKERIKELNVSEQRDRATEVSDSLASLPRSLAHAMVRMETLTVLSLNLAPDCLHKILLHAASPLGSDAPWLKRLRRLSILSEDQDPTTHRIEDCEEAGDLLYQLLHKTRAPVPSHQKNVEPLKFFKLSSDFSPRLHEQEDFYRTISTRFEVCDGHLRKIGERARTDET